MRLNNFDLIRLLAAGQVMVRHYLLYVTPGAPPWVFTALSCFPGVPVFFFISGLLVAASLERSPRLGGYAAKRALRIFPGLWASALLMGVLIAVAFPISALHLIAVVLAKATLGQDWNPDFLRDYGTGVPNAALWTIPVELSFYVFLPLIYRFARRRLDAALVVVAGLSFALLGVLDALPASGARDAALLTPLPFVGMFCVGVLAHRHAERLGPYVSGKALHWTGAFVAVSLLTASVDLSGVLRTRGNTLGPLSFLLLAGLVLSLAHTRPALADRILRHHDLSYGIYILHLPILNALIEADAGRWAFLGLPITVVVAGTSWILVERPALRRKPRDARPQLGDQPLPVA